ncbi:ABC transporter ATP-binding protein [Aureimonas sp. AU40]|uniref:ABC transporter ATP-binding protein n=1 Tax=Aureimonas sp. AU40 TaxID=1637747 RepID=UPI000783486B|nr:ABC transporter ATP-binding protein [Aureimonas sp. AU40]
MTLLRLDGVSRFFGSVRAVDGIDLAVAPASRTAVVGPSGSGKSTLLRLIAGFEAPDAGRITLGDLILAEPGRALHPHQRPIGLVSQDGALFPHLDLVANIGFGMDKRLKDRAERILALMDLVELDRSLRHRRPHELSGGQQQRVALARALARRPKLMLLDEPFSALDAGLRDSLRRKVAEVLEAQGIAAILVTHDQGEALTFAHQLAVLRDGRLQQVGEPRALYLQPNDAATAAFLGPAILLDAVLEADGWARCALGRVRTNESGTAGGSARLLLRPEQLLLGQAGEGADGMRARVTDVEFGGPVCQVGLDLSGAAGEGVSLRVPVSGALAPRAGEFVSVEVRGAAHLFRP